MTSHPRFPGPASIVAAAVMAVVLLAACATLERRSTTPVMALPHHALPVRTAIAQIRHGNAARFELCAVDACPKPSVKTLATPTPTPPLAFALAASIAAVPSIPTALPTLEVPAVAAAPRVELTRAPRAPINAVVVTFATGSAELSAAARQELAEVTASARGARVIELRGRTDALGPYELNEGLARERALAVRDHLRAMTLAAGTAIRVSFKGSCCYVAGNDTAAGRAANRRVEIEWHSDLQLAKDDS